MPLTPEDFEIGQTKIILYTKHFQKEPNGTKCRTQHHREKWHCGHNDHSSIDLTIAGITSNLVNSPEHTQRLTYRIVLTGRKNSFNSTWSKKCHGIH